MTELTLIDTLVTSMLTVPDTWEVFYSYVVIKSPGSRIRVYKDGQVALYTVNIPGSRAESSEVDVSFWERRRLKKAVATLVREKALRAVDRAALETGE